MGETMGHFARLQLVGKVTYYLGWVSLLCGGIFHFNIARNLFFSMGLTQRNLFEVAVVCFLICVASELRALNPAEANAPVTMKKAA
jgi:hypothetical protein